MKRLSVSQLAWKLIHITPMNPHNLLASDTTCGDVLRSYISGGVSVEDDDWLAPLSQKLDVPYANDIQIHAEAVLMALASNPSGESAKATGLEEVENPCSYSTSDLTDTFKFRC